MSAKCGWCGFGLEEDHLACAMKADDLRRYANELEAENKARAVQCEEAATAVQCARADRKRAERERENAQRLARAREDILRAEIERLTERQHALELDLAQCHEDCDEARDIARRAKKCCNDGAWRWIVLDGQPDPEWVAG